MGQVCQGWDEWAKNYADTVKHLPSLRHAQQCLEKGLAEHRAVAARIKNDAYRADFEAVFADEVAAAESALARIEKAIKNFSHDQKRGEPRWNKT